MKMKTFDFGEKVTATAVVDCLECENYYTGACDGNAGGCKAYKPARRVALDSDITLIKKLCFSTWGMTLFNFVISMTLFITAIATL